MSIFPRGFRLAAAVGAIVAAGVVLPNAASAAPNVVSGETYTMVPSHTSGAVKFLTVRNGSTASSARIIQDRSGSNGTLAHQKFRITRAGSTSAGRPYFRIRPTHANNMCFDVEGASLNDGARVIQFPCISGNRNQQFFFDAIFPGSDIHTITPRHSGKRLDIAGASTAAGAQLVQFGDNGGRNQRFLLTISTELHATGGGVHPPPVQAL